jgi:hypothetical protein
VGGCSPTVQLYCWWVEGAIYDDGDEADGAKGAEVRGYQSESTPQQRGGCKGGTGHMVLPGEEHAGA